MKIMLIDDKTTDVVTKLKDLKRRYHHVQVVNMTENESYRNGFPGEYLMSTFPVPKEVSTIVPFG